MSKAEGGALTRILCVDDEPAVLQGLALHLSRRYHLETATSGAEGLLVLRQDPTIAVVVSDMRMPGMDGAAFLARARDTAPDAVRMLLTGQADMDATIAAINQGGIFRFLTKPCPPRTLLTAIEAAVEQHRLVTAERVLLEQTLHGAIKALTDILALTNPVAFGRATRIKAMVSELCAKLEVRETWQVEVAAMLSQLGAMTLPPETAEKLHSGVPLTPEEQKMVARAPLVTEQLVRNVPRLDGVADILAAQARRRKGAEVAAVDLTSTRWIRRATRARRRSTPCAVASSATSLASSMRSASCAAVRARASESARCPWRSCAPAWSSSTTSRCPTARCWWRAASRSRPASWSASAT
jgi:response regulator RpfG family c-di-GMP phosphodiesterase